MPVLLGGPAYCGLPPEPAHLLSRWNPDPVLIGLLGVCLLAPRFLKWRRRAFFAGWAAFALAVLSPLCALSVSLFAARIGQHLIILLIAAPALAAALPVPSRPLTATVAFAALLWFWHAPGPYDATFHGAFVYWTMHLTLLAGAVLLWRALLFGAAVEAFAAGAATVAQMSALGAVLTFSAHPIYEAHLATTLAWGLSPLDDQRLGGLLMWVPGCLAFLVPALWRLATVLREDRHAALA